MKIFKKARIAGAVLLATAGIAVGTAQADSVLAPLVVSDSASGTETYFAFKMLGKRTDAGDVIADAFTKAGGVNPLDSPIHYYYIQKEQADGTPAGSFRDLYDYASTGGCNVTNTSGLGSPSDLIFQTAGDQNPTAGQNFNWAPWLTAADQSTPNGWLRDVVPFDSGPFYGMVIIDDALNAAATTGSNGRRDMEGELSGFVYVVNPALGIMLDYKLLNNPFSKRTGDFKTSWISKSSIDWMWLPATGANPNLNFERTGWYSAVTGEGMTLLAENAGGRWDESVTFTQADQTGNKSILPRFEKNSHDAPGAYDNDEEVISGSKDFEVKCLGLYDRSQFLTLQQYSHTRFGGWKRAHIVPSLGAGNGVQAHGAITYRMDDLNGATVSPL